MASATRSAFVEAVVRGGPADADADHGKPVPAGNAQRKCEVGARQRHRDLHDVHPEQDRDRVLHRHELLGRDIRDRIAERSREHRERRRLERLEVRAA